MASLINKSSEVSVVGAENYPIIKSVNPKKVLKWHKEVKKSEKKSLYNKKFPLPADVILKILSYAERQDYAARFTINKDFSPYIIVKLNANESIRALVLIKIFLFILYDKEANFIKLKLKSIDGIGNNISDLINNASGKIFIQHLNAIENFEKIKALNPKKKWTFNQNLIDNLEKTYQDLLSQKLRLASLESIIWKIKKELMNLPDYVFHSRKFTSMQRALKNLENSFPLLNPLEVILSKSELKEFRRILDKSSFRENLHFLIQIREDLDNLLNKKEIISSFENANHYKILEDLITAGEVSCMLEIVERFFSKNIEKKGKETDFQSAIYKICKYLANRKNFLGCAKIFKAIELISNHFPIVYLNHIAGEAFGKDIDFVANVMPEAMRLSFRLTNFR